MYGPLLRDAHLYGFNSMPVPPGIFSYQDYRQQPYPLMQGMKGEPYPYLNPYQISNFQPVHGVNPYYFQPVQGTQALQQPPVYQQTINGSAPQDVFQNPLHPLGNATIQKQKTVSSSNGYPYMNPYPKGSFLAKQPSGMQSVLNSFKSQDGTLDIGKMVDTAGQMMNAVSQVSSVVKGFGGMFKA